jgi:hypothetical protein
MISSGRDKIKTDVEVIDSNFDFGKIGRSGSSGQDLSPPGWKRTQGVR